MKLIRQPISMKPDPAEISLPGLCFTYKSQVYRITALLSAWRRSYQWWENRHPKTFYRVLTHTGAAFDLCHDDHTKQWLLWALHD